MEKLFKNIYKRNNKRNLFDDNDMKIKTKKIC